MAQYINEDSENPGKKHDDDGIIDDDSKENGLEEDEDFDGFHKNEDIISEFDWSTKRNLMGFTILMILPARMKRTICML